MKKAEKSTPTLSELMKLGEKYGVKVKDGSSRFKGMGIVGGVRKPHAEKKPT